MTTQKEKLNELLASVEARLNAVKEDAVKFVEKDNASAGTRVRTGSMDIIKTLKEVRALVSEIKTK
nr:MAG TPA: Histone H1-like protein Hc1 [Caudoviricetes sp.]